MTIFDDPTIIESQRRGLPGVAAGIPPQLLDGEGPPEDNPAIVDDAPPGSWYLDTLTGILYQLSGGAPVTGGELTAARLLQIESDLGDLNGHSLVSHPDVNIDTFVNEGFVLSFDPDGGGPGVARWVPRAPVVSNTLAVFGTPDELETAEGILFSSSFQTTEVGAVAGVQPVFAGTGSAASFARSDHAHTESFKRRKEWTYGAVVGSGTPTMDTYVTQALATGIVYDIDVDVVVDAYGSGGSASSARIIIEVDGVATTGTAKVYEAGVNGDKHLSAVATITGTGSTENIVVKVQFVSGAGPYVVGGYTKYSADTRR